MDIHIEEGVSARDTPAVPAGTFGMQLADDTYIVFQVFSAVLIVSYRFELWNKLFTKVTVSAVRVFEMMHHNNETIY